MSSTPYLNQMGIKTTNKDQGPATPCAAYISMLSNWQMIEDLLGGTEKMRAAGATYLPKEAAESDAGWQSRLNRTFLFNGMERSVKTLVGKPFAEEVHFSKDLQGEAAAWMADVDKQGNDLTTFAKTAFRTGIAKGLVHILVEYPAVKTPIMLSDKTAQDIRPYLVLVDPCNLIGWQYVVERGHTVLTQIRIMEVATVQVGAWGEATVRRVRVFDRIAVDNKSYVAYRLFEEQKDPNQPSATKWVLIESGDTTTAEIPLVTAYFGEKTGLMTAKPPLVDLAWLNIEHWQSSSDQRHILHVARVPIWFLKGYQPNLDENGAPKEKITIGPDRMIRVSSPDADLKIVEHTGQAIKAGRDDLQDIEARMAIAGAEMLARKAKGETTATEEAHDNTAEDSDLSADVKALEDALTNAIHFMFEWEKKEAPAGKLVTINKDFGLTAQDAADLQTLLDSRIKGELSHITFLKELQRRGVLAPSVDINKELELAKADGPFIDPNKAAPGPDAGGIGNKAGAGA